MRKADTHLTVSSCSTVPSGFTLSAKGPLPGSSSSSRMAGVSSESSLSSNFRLTPDRKVSTAALISISAVPFRVSISREASMKESPPSPGISSSSVTSDVIGSIGSLTMGESAAVDDGVGDDPDWTPPNSALRTSAALMLAIRIALRLATMSRLEPPRARVAALAFWTASTVFGPPKPIESARAAKSGRGGREACRGGNAAGGVGSAVKFKDSEGPLLWVWSLFPSMSNFRRLAFWSCRSSASKENAKSGD
ncbi:hypothetical protein BDM02DRAFT_178776 [Thelephora ganbajun]|uniref:Uncharacterized protein n=1 Tax=Thelephora ganbajun TaxID=370292 RepID=A0ACB6ZRA8_THEGA|nr:hypothetical protein BDM02DRAFT_178776 [Thelephora ganbajun]